MDARRRSNLAGGVLLVLLGAWFLALQLFPGLQSLLNLSLTWPLIVAGVGVFLLVLGLAIGVAPLAIPACIVGGIGGILYYQNATGDWESWAYLWTLIPGFVGVGIILAGLLSGKTRPALREGAGAIFSSLILFLIFGSFLGGFNLLGQYWPALLIVAGVLLLGRNLLRR